jgi:hypothetical protein
MSVPTSDFLRVHLPDSQTKVIRKSPKFTPNDVMTIIAEKVRIDVKNHYVKLTLQDGSCVNPPPAQPLDSYPYTTVTVCRRSDSLPCLSTGSEAPSKKGPFCLRLLTSF